MRKIACVAAAILACSGAASAAELRVIDGDTIVLDGVHIRLWGIDAPEKAQTCAGRDGSTYECGRDATAVMVELTRGKTVQCETKDTDRYHRTVAVCRTDAGELNAAMVRRGWAVQYRRYSHGAYDTEEAAAKAAGLGIWSGRFTMPEDYRKGQR